MRAPIVPTFHPASLSSILRRIRHELAVGVGHIALPVEHDESAQQFALDIMLAAVGPRDLDLGEALRGVLFGDQPASPLKGDLVLFIIQAGDLDRDVLVKVLPALADGGRVCRCWRNAID